MGEYDAVRIIQGINVFQQKINDKLCACCSGVSLSPMQAVILYYILNEETKRTVYPKDIAKEFGLSYATISQTLKKLKNYGYITIARETDDARLRKLTTTSKARSVDVEIKERLTDLYEYLRDYYTSDEIVQLGALLDRF